MEKWIQSRVPREVVESKRRCLTTGACKLLHFHDSFHVFNVLSGGDQPRPYDPRPFFAWGTSGASRRWSQLRLFQRGSGCWASRDSLGSVKRGAEQIRSLSTEAFHLPMSIHPMFFFAQGSLDKREIGAVRMSMHSYSFALLDFAGLLLPDFVVFWHLERQWPWTSAGGNTFARDGATKLWKISLEPSSWMRSWLRPTTTAASLEDSKVLKVLQRMKTWQMPWQCTIWKLRCGCGSSGSGCASVSILEENQKVRKLPRMPISWSPLQVQTKMKTIGFCTNWRRESTMMGVFASCLMMFQFAVNTVYLLDPSCIAQIVVWTTHNNSGPVTFCTDKSLGMGLHINEAQEMKRWNPIFSDLDQPRQPGEYPPWFKHYKEAANETKQGLLILQLTDSYLQLLGWTDFFCWSREYKYVGCERIQCVWCCLLTCWGPKPADGNSVTYGNPSLCTSMYPAATVRLAELSNGRSSWKMLSFAGNSSERLWARSRGTWMQKIPQCKAPSCNLRRWQRLQRNRNTKHGASYLFGNWLTTSPRTLSGRKV